MKIDVKTEQKSEIAENSVKLEPEDKAILENTEMQFFDIISTVKEDIATTGNIPFVSLPPVDFQYDTLSMSEDDAKFFVSLTKNEGMFVLPQSNTENGIQLVKAEALQNTVSTKAVEVSNKLEELITKAKDTQKPVRIAFDNDVSVILKIDKHGKVSAEFIPGNSEVESYLKNNIASLRQKFDEQNLPYNDLFYRDSKRERNNRNKRNNKGE